MVKIAILLSSLIFLFKLTTNNSQLTTVSADIDCSNPSFGEIDVCLDRIKGELDALKPAHEYNKKELEGLKKQIAGLNSQINGLSNQLKKTETEISGREKDLEFAQGIFENNLSL